MSECNKEVSTNSVRVEHQDDHLPKDKQEDDNNNNINGTVNHDHHCNVNDNASKSQSEQVENATRVNDPVKEENMCEKIEGHEQSSNNNNDDDSHDDSNIEDEKKETEIMEEEEDEEEEEEEEEESSEESMGEMFDSDEAAERARADGLKEYNAGNYNAALDIQYKIVRYFEHTYGAKAAESGKYFLDYGLSQLRVLQLESSIDAVLQPRDVKQMEACYVNLSMAREGLQKKEQAISRKLQSLRQSLHSHTKHTHSGNHHHRHTSDTKECEENEEEQQEQLQRVFEQYVDVQLSIADVHNALAQLDVEIEDFDNALKEYEVELLLYRELQEEEEQLNRQHEKSFTHQHQQHHTKSKVESTHEVNTKSPNITHTKELVPPQRIISTLYGIADCYMKEADYDNAEERLQMTLDEIHKYPAGTVAPELVEELQEFLEDAKEMKGGKYKEIQQTIQEQLAGEAERLPTAHEFYEVGNDDKHPFLSSLPDGHESINEMNEGSHLSMPMSLTGNMLGFNEHSNTNSQSISHFPHQSNSQGFVMNGNTTNGHPHPQQHYLPISEVNHTNGVSANANGSNNTSSFTTTSAVTNNNHTVQVVQARKKPKTASHNTNVQIQPTLMQPSPTMEQQQSQPTQHNSSNTETHVQNEEMHNMKRARV